MNAEKYKPVNLRADHPIWGILRIAVVLCGLTALLWFNANTFDKTEWATVAEFAAAAGGIKTWEHFRKQ